jgi:glucoamylase
VLLQRVRFEPISPKDRLQLWAILLPAIGNEAYGNDAFADPARNMLTAVRGNFALALTASSGFLRQGCFYQGPDDLWNRLKDGRAIDDLPNHAISGNVLVAGEIDYRKSSGEFLLALAFGESSDKAIQLASESLMNDFDSLASRYRTEWQTYRSRCIDLKGISNDRVYDTSVAVLKTNLSKVPSGGIVASLGVPWGETEQKIVDFRYQLCWTRDAVESAGAFIAMGDVESAKSAWNFLMATQQKDGHWAQNMWLDGRPHWSGIQMDETALPILLADMLRRHGLIQPDAAWSTVRQAAAYLVQNGPGTEQDRWENDGGYSPYTLAVEVAALLAAAEFARLTGETAVAEYLTVIADCWNDSIEDWIFLDEHYVRLSTPQKNRAHETRQWTVQKDAHSTSTAALALVRFGLRAATDPRMQRTVEDIDKRLKAETATGPVWHRYLNDHYGEYADGRPFDGGGIGRGWPVLTGERAHFEILRANCDEARKLAAVIEKQTNTSAFLPEQVWDTTDLPERNLRSGRPSGSAMPLVWAHAEYIKLLRSLRDGKVFDLPPQPVERYQRQGVQSLYRWWSTGHKITSMPSHKILRIQTPEPAKVYWTLDCWKTVQCSDTTDSQLAVHYCDLATSDLDPGSRVGFTFCWHANTRWENRAYELAVK